MGHLKKLDSGAWQAVYRDPSGKQRRKSFPTQRQAQRFLGRVSADLQRGQWHDPRLGKVTVENWIVEWWDTTVNLRQSTRARNEFIIQKQLLPRFGPMPLSSLTPLQVRAWVADMTARGQAPATVKKNYLLLRKLLAAAVDVGLIPYSPCKAVSLPKIEHREMRFLRPEEVWRLAREIDPRFRCLVLLGAYGGLRWGEMAGLRTSRLDLMKGRVDIAEILVDVSGRLWFGPPKTQAGRRTVTLPRTVVDELAAHIAGRPDTDSDLVFQAPEGGPLRRSVFRSRTWIPAVNGANLSPLRVHDLRHTAISFWILAGAHVREIAARAGHTSASVVLDRYGHIFPEADSKLRDALDAIAQAAKNQEPPEAQIINFPKGRILGHGEGGRA